MRYSDLCRVSVPLVLTVDFTGVESPGGGMNQEWVAILEALEIYVNDQMDAIEDGYGRTIPNYTISPVRALEAPPAGGRSPGYTPTTPPQEPAVAPTSGRTWHNKPASEELEFLYTLRDYLDSENTGAMGIVDDCRDLVYERIQLKEMQEWNL